MFVYLLLVGGLLYGAAAFADGRVYALAGIVFCVWLAMALVRAVIRRARTPRTPRTGSR